MTDVFEEFLGTTQSKPAESKPASQPGIVQIRDKNYRMVALRVYLFREKYPDYCIETAILADDGDTVRMQCQIKDKFGRLLATGMAQETRDSSNINRSSHIENCETSAVGRAIAFMGLSGEDMQISSSEEMESALRDQEYYDVNKYLIRHNEVWRDNYKSVNYIKEAIENDDIFAAVEGYVELGEEVQIALNVAPTKGGCWTKEEKKVIRSSEFNKAIKEYKTNEQV